MKLNSRLRLFLLGSTLLANVSVQGQTVIYEPFANSDLSLTGNAAGTGLTGNWTASTTLGVTVGSSLTWGTTLPTSGNRVAYTGGAANTTASVGLSSALSSSGLLADGSSTWFSLVFNTPTNNGINEDLSFILGTDVLAGTNGIGISASGSGLGFTFNSGGLKATSYNAGTRTQSGTAVALTTNTTYLITGQLIFGTGGASDTVKLYLPDTGLSLGNVRSSISAALNQSVFDTLAFGMKSNTAVGFDEIRLGGTYLDSVGMSTTSAYWDLNDTATGTGSASPSNTWNAGDLSWNPSAAGTGTSAAWTPGQTAVFSAGSDATGSYTVTVDSTQSIGGVVFKNGTVNISGGTALDLVSAGGAIEVRDATKTSTISTPIIQSSGSGALYKEGGGTLVLSGNNTYAGATIVNAGKLVLSGNNTGAVGAIQINGGITQFDSLAAISSSGRSVTVGAGAVTVFGSTLSNTDIATGLGRIVTTSAGIIAADNNGGGDFSLSTAGLTAAGFGAVGTVNYTGILTPNGNYRLGGAGGSLTMANLNALTGAGKTLTVSGPGTVTLALSNNYTGITTVSSGATLIMSASNSATTTTISAGGTLVVGNSSSTGGAGVTLSGTGSTLIAASNFSVGGNQLFYNTGSKIMSDGTTPRSITGLLKGNSGHILQLGDSTNTGKLTFNSSPLGTSGGFNMQCNSDVEFAAGLNTGADTVTKTGSGTMIISSASAHTGATAVSSGALRIGNNTALGTTTNGASVASGAALELYNNITIGAEPLSNLNGTGLSNGGALRNISGDNTYGGLITLGSASRINSDAGTLTLDVASGNAITGTFNLTFGGLGNVSVADPIATSTGTLTKDGAGTLTLTGANLYTGVTTVSAGKLLINGNSITATGAVNVNAGTLGGTGITGGAVTVAGGATLAPGASIESLATGSLSLLANSTFAQEIDDAFASGNTSGDLTVVSGILNLAATNNSILNLFEVGASGGWGAGNKITLIGYSSGTWNGGLFTYNSSTLNDDSTFNFSGVDWTFNYNDTTSGDNYQTDMSGFIPGTAKYVTMTAVPEPNVAALIGALGGILLLRRRRA